MGNVVYKYNDHEQTYSSCLEIDPFGYIFVLHLRRGVLLFLPPSCKVITVK